MLDREHKLQVFMNVP